MAGMHQPLFTTEEARHLKPDLFDNPGQMIYDFCFMLDSKECHKMLWKMIRAFLSSEYSNGLNQHERGDYLFFYEMLSSLLEAIYLIDAKRALVKS